MSGFEPRELPQQNGALPISHPSSHFPTHLEKDAEKEISATGQYMQNMCLIIVLDNLEVKLLELTANANVATIMSSIQASSDIVESEGQQMKQC